MDKISEKDQAIADLKKAMPSGTTVYTILRYVSKSGMSRVIDIYTFVDNMPQRWSWSVAKAIDWTYDKKHEGVRVGGCGMDMGFHLVDTLNRVLYNEGGANPGDKLVQRWL